MIAERGNCFTWTYTEQGPAIWKVLIKKNSVDEGQTVGEIAAADVRKAEVFKKYGIDFCCGGKKTLKQACQDLRLDLDKIEEEVKAAQTTVESKPFFDFNRWDADFLADYIYNEHHLYYYRQNPVLCGLLEKVVNHHGQNHPELLQVANLYNILQTELNAHFIKEEKVLFPYIKNLAAANRNNTDAVPTSFDTITGPLQIMEADHEAAGELLEELRNTTNNYSAPADACNSFTMLYMKLKELDEDLHQHIHLENNILSKKALKLEKEFANGEVVA